ncbi:HDOD domain-containing protein [Alteromonas sediminis]|uniref:HDOD domain-containing protein n=1 Tax=Alteromonas sediminis TaxID=2259342 RepID=A0A3N5Y0F4_9ALTE|nr:HDOD domain-containing protein [Alteromonas sediminis]RPJ67137.1 HDOD domain-containing protein [Alteromonas sediminis]
MTSDASGQPIPVKVLSSLLVSAIDAAGQDSVNACINAQSGLSFAEFSKREHNTDAINALLQALSDTTQIPLFSFEMGWALSPRSFGSYGRALYSSPSWTTWCRTAVKFADHIGLPSGALSVGKSHDKAALQFHGLNFEAHQLDLFYTGALLRLYLLSSESNQQASVHIRNDVIPIVNESFGLSCTATSNSCLILSFTGSAGLPRLANAKVHAVFVRDMSQLGSEEEPHPLAFHVQRLIESQANLHHVNQSWVAEKLNMSERNLLRKLKSANISFRDLFNRVRSKRSLDLLFSGMSIGEIGNALGYSERATFERAFKTWQGITPVAMQSRFASLAAEHKIDNLITAESIPAPPTMLPKLVSLIGDDDFHIDELVALVESDPVITSKVLTIANSALYGYSGIASVKQAILTVLGVQKLQAIVITILSTDVFSDLPSHFPYDRFWFRSLAAAQISAELADIAGIKSDQKFTIYIAALLHNIGHLGLAYCLSEGFEELMHEDMDSLSWREQINLQRLRLGIHSVQVTEVLLNLWAFPSDIVKVLRESGICSDFLNADTNKAPSILHQTLKLVEIAEQCWKDESATKDQVSVYIASELSDGDQKTQIFEPLSDKLVAICSALWEHAGTLVLK